MSDEEDQWETPDEYRHFYTWDDVKGVVEVDPPFDYPGTGRPRADPFQPSTSGIGRLPRPANQTRQRDIASSISVRPRTPSIVQQFQNPDTGDLDFEALSSHVRSHPLRSTGHAAIGQELAARNRQVMSDIYSWPNNLDRRMSRRLESRGFRHNPATGRFESHTFHEPIPDSERGALVPRRDSDVSALIDPRFSRPIRSMGRPGYSDTLPYSSMTRPYQQSSFNDRLLPRITPATIEEANRRRAAHVMQKGMHNWSETLPRSKRRKKYRGRVQMPVSDRYRASIRIPHSTSEKPEIWRDRRKKWKKNVSRLKFW